MIPTGPIGNALRLLHIAIYAVPILLIIIVILALMVIF